MKRILIIFLIMIGVYLLFSSNNSSWLPFAKGDTEAELTDEINVINIDVSSVSATIIPDSRNNIHAELDGKGDVEVTTRGNEIRVDYQRNWFNVFQFFNKTPKLNIYIPEDYNRELAIQVGSGNVDFSVSPKNEPTKLQHLMVEMSSGRVNLNHIHATEFTHDGSSGLLSVDGLITETGEIEMSSGKTQIKGYEGKLKGEVSSGEMNIQIDKLIGDIDLEASSGRINLDLPDDADFTLNGKASSGRITSDFDLDSQTNDDGDLMGTSGSGKYQVDLSISSGSAEIH